MQKVFFCVVIALSCFTSFSQRLSLSVKPDDKVTMHGFCYWQELQVRSKDTSFTYRLHSQSPDMIRNLKQGPYWLTARSLFNHTVTKKVAVNKKTPVVKLKGLQSFYKRVPEGKNLSEKLKLNDTLYILYNSNANEAEKEKIAVTKTSLGYKAIQYRGTSNEVFQEMLLKDGLYEHVIKFEKEGKKAHSPKGDTAPRAEIYTIELNKEIISFLVPGEWGGLNNLKAILFIVEQK